MRRPRADMWRGSNAYEAPRPAPAVAARDAAPLRASAEGRLLSLKQRTQKRRQAAERRWQAAREAEHEAAQRALEERRERLRTQRGYIYAQRQPAPRVNVASRRGGARTMPCARGRDGAYAAAGRENAGAGANRTTPGTVAPAVTSARGNSELREHIAARRRQVREGERARRQAEQQQGARLQAPSPFDALKAEAADGLATLLDEALPAPPQPAQRAQRVVPQQRAVAAPPAVTTFVAPRRTSPDRPATPPRQPTLCVSPRGAGAAAERAEARRRERVAAAAAKAAEARREAKAAAARRWQQEQAEEARRAAAAELERQHREAAAAAARIEREAVVTAAAEAAAEARELARRAGAAVPAAQSPPHAAFTAAPIAPRSLAAKPLQNTDEALGERLAQARAEEAADVERRASALGASSASAGRRGEPASPDSAMGSWPSDKGRGLEAAIAMAEAQADGGKSLSFSTGEVTAAATLAARSSTPDMVDALPLPPAQERPKATQNKFDRLAEETVAAAVAKQISGDDGDRVGMVGDVAVVDLEGPAHAPVVAMRQLTRDAGTGVGCSLQATPREALHSVAVQSSIVLARPPAPPAPQRRECAVAVQQSLDFGAPDDPARDALACIVKEQGEEIAALRRMLVAQQGLQRERDALHAHALAAAAASRPAGAPTPLSIPPPPSELGLPFNVSMESSSELGLDAASVARGEAREEELDQWPSVVDDAEVIAEVLPEAPEAEASVAPSEAPSEFVSLGEEVPRGAEAQLKRDGSYAANAAIERARARRVADARQRSAKPRRERQSEAGMAAQEAAPAELMQSLAALAGEQQRQQARDPPQAPRAHAPSREAPGTRPARAQYRPPPPVRVAPAAATAHHRRRQGAASRTAADLARAPRNSRGDVRTGLTLDEDDLLASLARLDGRLAHLASPGKGETCVRVELLGPPSPERAAARRVGSAPAAEVYTPGVSGFPQRYGAPSQPALKPRNATADGGARARERGGMRRGGRITRTGALTANPRLRPWE